MMSLSVEVILNDSGGASGSGRYSAAKIISKVRGWLGRM
jgi:hypothetical protein